MTTERGRILALSRLVDHQEAGGYTLPTGVLDAYTAHQAAKAIAVPGQPPVLHPDDAAAGLVDDLLAGGDVDLDGAASALDGAREAARRVELAGQLHALIVERTGQLAASAAIGAADRVITDSLRPPYEQVLAEAAGHAERLGGHRLDGTGWDAPTKVRTARRELAELADRLRALRDARQLVSTIAEAQPQHDVQHMFALLRRPQVLAPGWEPDARPLPRPDVPADPVAGLLWLVTVAQPAEPWLPTVGEQDSAWLAVFGESRQHRRSAAVSARAHAGASV